MPFLFLLFFRLGGLLFHVAGFPDVDFRFRARLEPFDVLAVRVDQQHGDDEREHDEIKIFEQSGQLETRVQDSGRIDAFFHGDILEFEQSLEEGIGSRLVCLESLFMARGIVLGGGGAGRDE